MQSFDLSVDVTEAAGVGEPAHITVNVTLPDPSALGPEPIVCFAKPGGGYSRLYYSDDLPGPAKGAQAAFHAEHGWIFIGVDHLGVGASSLHDESKLTTDNLTAAAQAAETEILSRLETGTLAEGFPAISDPLVLGIGQSLGGYLTIRQHGRYDCYDGMAALGYSAVLNRLATPEGTGADKPAQTPWALDGDEKAKQVAEFSWGFIYSDDTDPQITFEEFNDFPFREGKLHPWHSGTMPFAVVAEATGDGSFARRAAANITTPVLIASAERDVIPDFQGEAKAYPRSSSIELYRCLKMGHMHNFASTRVQFWERIERWADNVRAIRREDRELAK